MILLADGSHWRTANVATLKAAGVQAMAWKATDGGTFVDPSWAPMVEECVRAGVPLLAIHYQEAVNSPESELANIRRAVSPATSIVLDVEKNSGDVLHTRRLVDALHNAGYNVPFIYLPEWYWEQIGKPDLSGLPPLWASHYIGGAGDPVTSVAQVPISWWHGYGNNAPLLLQYMSTGSVVNGGTVGDFSLFAGDYDQFLRYLTPALWVDAEKDDEVGQNVPLPLGTNRHISMGCAGYSKFRIPTGYDDVISLLQFDFNFDTPPGSPDPAFVANAGWNADPDGDGISDHAWRVAPNRPGPWAIPPGATELSVRYNAPELAQPLYLYLGN